MTFASWSLTGPEKTSDANDDDYKRHKTKAGLFSPSLNTLNPYFAHHRYSIPSDLKKRKRKRYRSHRIAETMTSNYQWII